VILLLREISLHLTENESILALKVADYLKLSEAQIRDLKIIRSGIDARKKPQIRRIYTVSFSIPDQCIDLDKIANDHRLSSVLAPATIPFWTVTKPHKALVVGMGPAGLFSALHLARRGVDVTLVERGKPVEERSADVQRFWTDGQLDTTSNVQFGEGGAGTFSDGKLTTRINSVWHRLVLETLVDCGAPDRILTEAKPHLGTDILHKVLVNFRQKLIDAGVQIRFNTVLDGLQIRKDRVTAGLFGNEEYLCDTLVLAPGHSARDTYAMLAQAGVQMDLKPFAIGLRVEHPRELINRIQFGHPDHPLLPSADYALSYNDRETGRGFYSFCMCPGGRVIAACSEEGGMVVNGMSSSTRTEPFSNSALVVSVRPEDFSGTDVLAGVRFQRDWERAAFVAGGGDYKAPAQNLLDFMAMGSGPFASTCRPGVREADLKSVLPTEIIEVMQRGLPHFDRKMRGFITREATLIGIESRTSAPLRIQRDKESGESLSHRGLYPVGEGAGYAGGIMSAAIDGIKSAEQIVARLRCGDLN
jgi:uncharacterized FAD-dependent dehydrogenase